MAVQLTVDEEAMPELRALFSAVEGSCEVWTDEEVVTRLLVRGVMAYGQTAGRDFQDMAEMARSLRGRITVG